MENKTNKHTKYQIAANICSIAMVVLLTVVFVFETWLTRTEYNSVMVVTSVILAMVIVGTAIKGTWDYSSLAFFIPFVLLLLHTALMLIGRWYSSQYLLVCFAICGISCIYSNYNRTIGFFVTQNFVILALVLTGNPVSGRGVPTAILLANWAIFLFAGIILIRLTKSATIILDKALVQQNSFMNLLASTENYVAIVDEHNKVLYASKTLSQLGMVEEPTLVQGRPLIDLFPGRNLKVYAGRMLAQKGDYAEDWEFSLNGQKRYFKAASHSLPGGYNNGTLINLYDMTHLAERDEIAAMKDSMKIGLFFMDQNNIIQDHYSRYLEEMLSETNLFGKSFTDLIADSVAPSELRNIKDYLDMVIKHSFDQEMLDDINPLNELRYFNKRNGIRKVFQCGFAVVERGHGENFLLVTVYDITAKVELQKKLAEEQSKRQEEMQSVFELIQVDPGVFNDFIQDMEYEFNAIDKVLKDKKLSSHDTLVKTYQSIHAIKSNAVILGLNVFGNKAHSLESVIKKLREQKEEVPFSEMLNLTMQIEQLSNERESFKMVIEKLQSYTGTAGPGGRKQNVNVMIEALAKTVDKASADMGRKIRFINEVDPAAVERGPRREMKEILMQLIRNSVAHGIEPPEERIAKGKNETGIIKLTIKFISNIISIELRDDGRGLDYKKIAEKAVRNKIIKREDATNKNMLIKAIFAPGFSTAENEGMHAGRGIGLNLVRDRVKEIKGAIKLRSEPNKGTAFLITIPIERRKPRTPEQGSPAPNSQNP